MKTVMVLISALLVLAATGICETADSDLTKENDDLRQRVSNLEKELAELKSIVLKNNAAEKVEKTESPAATTKLTDAQLEEIAQMVENKSDAKKGPFSNIELTPYGYIKWDASYDDSELDPGNFGRWVDSEAGQDNDDQFNMTANQTRLGLRINTRDDSYIKSSGLVEVDFFGNGTAENKPGILVRHAYAKLDWPEERFSILAGQTWDVISPLNPYTLNYSVQWWAGNIGYRRPQIRATKSFTVNGDVDLKVEGAITRNIGFSDSGTFPNIADDAGEDSGVPGLQGRVSTTFPLLGYRPTTIGFSGHWAKEEIDINAAGRHRDFDSWSVNLDVTQPINKWLTIKGELFSGENLSSYLGGIGQGINTTRMSEIRSRGGWVAASLGPWDKWNFNLGVSIDDPKNNDLNTGNRSFNRAIFGNAIYSINRSTQLGFELSQWNTDYKGQRDADAVRAQTSLIYKF